MCAAISIDMPTTSAFESISTDELSSITGGCGKKRCQCPPPQPPQPPPAQALPAAPPSAPEVSTNVSISGYGAA